MSVKVKPRAQNKSHFNIPQVQCPLKIRCPFLSLSKVNDRFPPKSFLPLPYIKQCTFYCPILHHRARERERDEGDIQGDYGGNLGNGSEPCHSGRPNLGATS